MCFPVDQLSQQTAYFVRGSFRMGHRLREYGQFVNASPDVLPGITPTTSEASRAVQGYGLADDSAGTTILAGQRDRPKGDGKVLTTRWAINRSWMVVQGQGTWVGSKALLCRSVGRLLLIGLAGFAGCKFPDQNPDAVPVPRTMTAKQYPPAMLMPAPKSPPYNTSAIYEDCQSGAEMSARAIKK